MTQVLILLSHQLRVHMGAGALSARLWHDDGRAREHFVGSIASNYETRWPSLFEPAVVDAAVDFLAETAGPGPVLEFGIGTGRLALPLSRRGVRVYGLELSADMVAVLRSHEGADVIGVTIGDFAAAQVDGALGSCTLVYLVRNTIMNLTTQDEQVACFANAAAHLAPEGTSSPR